MMKEPHHLQLLSEYLIKLAKGKLLLQVII